jgi:oligopeptide transport system ATP-binding protein
VVEQAPARQLYADPRHPYTQGLLASIPRLDADTSVRLVPIQGSPPDLAALPAGCAFAPRCQYATAACSAQRPVLRNVTADHSHACILDELPA